MGQSVGRVAFHTSMSFRRAEACQYSTSRRSVPEIALQETTIGYRKRGVNARRYHGGNGLEDVRGCG